MTDVYSELTALALVVVAPLAVGFAVSKIVDARVTTDCALTPTLAHDLGSAIMFTMFIGALVVNGAWRFSCASTVCASHAVWHDAIIPAVVVPMVVAFVAYKVAGGAAIVRRLIAALKRAAQY
jgi:hypothetical protein